MKSKELILEIHKGLMNATYLYDTGLTITDRNIIIKDHEEKIFDVVSSIVNELNDNKIARLEAKVFAYEQIISKSNFKPFVDKEETENE